MPTTVRSLTRRTLAPLALGAALLLAACPADDASTDGEATDDGQEAAATVAERATRDVHSFATPDEVAVTHLDLDLAVDFDARTLSGVARLDLDRRSDSASTLVLDTRDLTIEKVLASTDVGATNDGAADDGAADVAADDELVEAEWSLGDAVEFMGQALEIELPEGASRVDVHYTTSPDAAALLWLDPSQTAGGEHPFLFTQSQAILARTWVPIQDSPGVRFTYDATVRVPRGLIALMSAENPQAKNADGVYTFSMPQAIPSYLLALAVGDLVFRDLGEGDDGDTVGVYAEPPVIEKAVYEFAETPDMMSAVEEMYGPYRWGRYDILVLPAGFPFGGMENPRLTFVTPTILAGDRSLVALIAHELAHSWSGNLVTNATWNDFWLNEGFTVYLERRIMEELEGRDYSEMLALLGLQDLEGTVADLDAPETHLYLHLENRDPDEGMTDVAYEKGYFFLRSLEEAVGRERFDDFLESWFEQGAFQSVTTEGFLAYLDRELIAGDEELRAKLAVDDWVDGPGIPANASTVESARFDAVDAQLQAFRDGDAPSSLETDGWTTHEWLRFLRGLPDEMSGEQMAALDDEFGFTSTGNSELLHAWLHHAVEHRYEPAYPALEDFLTGMGRRKFLQPLYARMAESDDTREMAVRIYREARPGYHSVSSNTVDEILDWSEPRS